MINSSAITGTGLHYLAYKAAVFNHGYVSLCFLASEVTYEALWANLPRFILYDAATMWPATFTLLHELIETHVKCPWAWSH